MSKIWVLTRTHNDYNQHGDYFVAAFKKLPTLDQLEKLIVANGGPCDGHTLTDYVLYVQKGGGRMQDVDDVWFNLNPVDLK